MPLKKKALAKDSGYKDSLPLNSLLMVMIWNIEEEGIKQVSWNG